jgi:uncharacterized protein (TIGR00251 family)
MEAAKAIRAAANGVSLTLTIAPRSGRDEIVGLAGDALKIRLKAPPVEGRANEALLDFLAKRLALPRSALAISAGATGRRKVVQVSGLTAEAVTQRLLAP